MVGRKYIWYKEKRTTKSRIDRVVVTKKWMGKWQDCKQYIQDKVVLDRCAIVVKIISIDWVPNHSS